MSEPSLSPAKSLPSPFLTRRTRTYSATRSANDGPLLLVSCIFVCIEINLNTWYRVLDKELETSLVIRLDPNNFPDN